MHSLKYSRHKSMVRNQQYRGTDLVTDMWRDLFSVIEITKYVSECAPKRTSRILCIARHTKLKISFDNARACDHEVERKVRGNFRACCGRVRRLRACGAKRARWVDIRAQKVWLSKVYIKPTISILYHVSISRCMYLQLQKHYVYSKTNIIGLCQKHYVTNIVGLCQLTAL